MKQVKAVPVPPNQNLRRGRAQVRILIGEGSAQRSVTRHIVRVGNNWIGLNPDDDAPGMRLRAEDDVKETCSRVEWVEKRIAELEGMLSKAKKMEDAATTDFFTRAVCSTVRELNEEELGLLRGKLEEAKKSLKDALACRDQVETDYPEKVEVVIC